MSKISKLPKRVDVYEKQVITYETIYTCPDCHTKFVGFVSGNTTRFMCQCGQELIVNRRMSVAGGEE